VAESQLRVLYDADCGFCRWSVAHLLLADKQSALLPLTIQSAEGQKLLSQVPQAERLSSAHCVTPDGHVTSGGAAYAVVAERIPRLVYTSPVAKALPSLVDLGYRGVANNRKLFSRWMTPARLAWADGVISERLFEAEGL